MNGTAIIIVLLLAIMIFATAIIMKNKQKDGTDSVSRYSVEAERKKRDIPVEKPEVTAAKKTLYQYLNQAIKKMFQYYQKDKWGSLHHFSAPPEEIIKYLKDIYATLPDSCTAMVKQFFSCINMQETEEQPAGIITDLNHLKEVFESMMLPFYPVYYKDLGELRYSTLLNQTMLKLFHCLTGKKFRMGFRNRYGNGVTSYTWAGEQYKVYDESGRMLCDACFRDGALWEGFGILPCDDFSDTDWDLIQEGYFHEGVFADGTLHYIYGKNCGRI